eukprot:4310558-Amphidinium_carterae.1
MRRCLAAALGPAGGMQVDKAGLSSVVGSRLTRMVKALSTTPASTPADELVKHVLETCHAEAKAFKGWAAPKGVKVSPMVVDEEDTADCHVQQ